MKLASICKIGHIERGLGGTSPSLPIHDCIQKIFYLNILHPLQEYIYINKCIIYDMI